MADFLVDHAIKNVWCSPEQDRQYILQAAKITPTNGRLGYATVMWRNIKFPDSTSQWHIYQVGGVHPLVFGLLPNGNNWVSFSSACNTQKMVCDIYTLNGIMLPRFETYFMYTRDGNLLICVRNNPKINFDFNGNIFVRMYKNAYFTSTRSNQLTDYVSVDGNNITNTPQLLLLQNNVAAFKLLPGETYCFVNGVKVDNISMLTASVGDSCEFIYDSSIIKIVDFPISNLNTFYSTLDSVNKYLLNYSGVDDGTIDYIDDIDVFVLEDLGNNKHQGVYFNKNNPIGLRNLTHRDYSLNSNFVSSYYQQLQTIAGSGRVLDPNKLFIRLHIRKSGYARSFINEANRIKELYKLPSASIPRAMLGLDSVVSNWTAANLESSMYTDIMGSKFININKQKVTDAYGYNAISKLIADTPTATIAIGNTKVAALPFGLQNYSTVYEYDANGLLLGFYTHTNSALYICINSTCTLIEVISGTGSMILDDTFGLNNVPINATNNSYRVYKAGKTSTGNDNIWVDVTNTSKYIVSNNTVVWTDATVDPFLCVRTDNRFLAYDLDLDASNGFMRFTLNETSNGVTEILKVPLGDLDIFLNGRSLIKNLDYFIRFPEIVITNKTYLSNPFTVTQKVHIRFTGFCTSDMTLRTDEDVGFIKYGYLSNNNRFDIRDDKVLRITIDGQLYTKSELQYSEEHTGVSYSNPKNGLPYQIKDIVVPMRGITIDDTYTIRNKSIVIDNAVSSYLTLKLPQANMTGANGINSRYAIYSPFISKIIYSVISKNINPKDLGNAYTDNQVIALCSPYLDYLNFDPITLANRPDSSYVTILPHYSPTVINLDFYQYKFITRVVNLYAKGVVDISAAITLTPI